MMKLKDGYKKLIGTTYTGSSDQILLSDGGNIQYATASTADTIVQRNSNSEIRGKLRYDTTSSYLEGRVQAPVANTHGSDSYQPLISSKVLNGSWEIVTYNGQIQFSYITDEAVSSGSNGAAHNLKFPKVTGTVLTNKNAYIGTTAVQTSSASQALTGITTVNNIKIQSKFVSSDGSTTVRNMYNVLGDTDADGNLIKNEWWLKPLRGEFGPDQTNLPWITGGYAAGIAFGGGDTKGAMSVRYDQPDIRFAGANPSSQWWVTIKGSHNQTYNLNKQYINRTSSNAVYPFVVANSSDTTGDATLYTDINSGYGYNPSKGEIKAAKFTGKIEWDNINNKPSSFTPAYHTHSELIRTVDARDVETSPSDYYNAFKFVGIKNNAKVGLESEGGTFVNIIGWKGWGDTSGPASWELASGSNSRLYVRSGGTNWSNWKAIAYTTDNFSSKQINTLTGYTKATAKAAITTTDSLNTALGKLEFKTDFIYNDLFGTDNDDIINKWSEIVDFISSVKEGTDITEEFVTRKTDQTITGTKNFNTNYNAATAQADTPLIISRNGRTDYECVKVSVDDATVQFLHMQDEKVSNFLFKGQYLDLENNANGANAGSHSVSFNLSNSEASIKIDSNLVLHSGNYTSYKHAYTNLTGSGSTANQAIVSNGVQNGWTLKTLGSRAFDSTDYLPLTGGTLTGNLNFNCTGSAKPGYVTWTGGTHNQRIEIIDSASDKNTFTFQQSTDSGSTWSNLCTITADGRVIANKFVTTGGTASQFVKGDGSLDGTTYATSDSLTDVNYRIGKGAYNFANGYLVKTKIPTESNTMVYFRIEGNDYNKVGGSILTTGQFYNYTIANKILSYSAHHHGYNFGKIQVFCYNGYVHMWWEPSTDYPTYIIHMYTENCPSIQNKNVVDSITNAAMPVSTDDKPITRLVEIVPMVDKVEGGGNTWGSNISVTLNGVTKTLTIPANPNTDTKVTQTHTSGDASYPILLAPAGQATTTTTTSYFNSDITVNPSKKKITAFTTGIFGQYKTSVNDCYTDGVHLTYFGNILQNGTSKTAGTSNQYGFPTINNANAILWVGTHGGPYGHQLGFSSNSNIYHRYIPNGVFPENNSWDMIQPVKSGYITSHTLGLSSYWRKMWEINQAEWGQDDTDLTLYIHSEYNRERGILHVGTRKNPSYITYILHQIVGNIPTDRFRLYYQDNGKFELWCNTRDQWNTYNYKVLSMTGRVTTEQYRGTFYSEVFDTEQTLPTSNYITITNIPTYTDKVGITTIGSSCKPIYLKAGVPTECQIYKYGTNSIITMTADGVTEVGKYIDFHAQDGVDYDVRITARTADDTYGAGLSLSGITYGTFRGNLTGNVTGNVTGTSTSLANTLFKENDNLNNFIEAGVYSSKQTSVCMSLVNKPSAMPEGECVLEVIHCADNTHVIQKFIAKNGNKETIYYRAYNNGSWSIWHTIARRSDIPTKISELTNDSTFIKGSALGGTYQPIYVNAQSEAVAGTSYAKAIKDITRSGNVFTYTCIDGTTGTFNQQDTTYNLTAQKQSLKLSATKGWYRIATSPLHIDRCMGDFEIEGTIASYHTVTKLNAAINYSNNPGITVINTSHYANAAITQARIVYHITYEQHYAYLEVYLEWDKAITLTTKLLNGYGWSLIQPVAGSIPEGYTSKTVSLVNNTLTTTGDLMFEINQDNSGSWNSPAVIFKRGVYDDNLIDWKLYVESGVLKIQNTATNNAPFKDVISFGTQSIPGIIASQSIKAPSFIGTLSGNATSASKLSNYYADRPSSNNIATLGDGSLLTFKQTSTTTEGKCPMDAHILHFNWDNNGNWDGQLALTTSTWPNLYMRGQSGSSSWGVWVKMLNDYNYTDYTVKKDGTGATGNWNISASKLTSTQIINKSFSLNHSTWTDTDYSFKDLATGTYAVQVTSGTNLVASGIMSVYNNLEDTTGDEIPLHVYGTAGWRPYLRTFKNKLQISSNDVNATSRTVTIKIAQIL